MVEDTKSYQNGSGLASEKDPRHWDIHESWWVFKTPPPFLSGYVQNVSAPLSLDVQFQTILPRFQL